MKTATNAAGAPSTSTLLRITLFIAALGGLTETALLAIARYGLGRFTHLNPDFAYLAPMWYMTAAMLVVAPALLLGRRLSERVRISIAVFPVVLVCSLGVLFLYVRLSRWTALVLAIGLAVQATRIAIARLPLVRTVAARGLPMLVATTAIIAAIMIAQPAISERRALSSVADAEQKPNVLFIIWDTVRAASLSLHGYHRPTTPALERLASEGVAFERAYSIAPWTLPSHASLFTGLAFHEMSADWLTPLEEEPTTLAELFAANGYATGGFVANFFYCSRESGLGQGFQRYDVYPTWSFAQFLLGSSVSRAFFNSSSLRLRIGLLDKPGRKIARDVNGEFVRWLDDIDGRPFFAFLNYFDAHHPYLPPAPWDTMFGPLLPGRDPSMEEGRSFTPRELAAEIDGYDGGIRSVDDHLGLLVAELERRGLRDNTIIVVTSDHGEEFGEHGVFTHGNTLYERSLHVPLVISAPRMTSGGVRVRDWVSTRDVAATIASIAGLEHGVKGTSLERFWNGGDVHPRQASAPDTLLAQVSYARGHPADYPVSHGDMQSVLAAPYQYIRQGDGTERVFELTDSLRALVDLSDDPAAAPVLRELKGHLRRTLPRYSATEAADSSGGDRSAETEPR